MTETDDRAEFEQYRRTNVAEMRPYIPGESLEGISVSDTDNPERDHGMVARNPQNHADQWYVARQYFEDNFEPLEQAAKASEAGSAQQAEPVRHGLWFDPPGFTRHGAIRIDWDNDRHQCVELWGDKPSEVFGALRQAANLLAHEVQQGHLSNNNQLDWAAYTTPPTAPVVPEGWQLVPIIPTREIEDSIASGRNLKVSEIWEDALDAAALASSPQPEQHPDDAAVDRFADAMKRKLAKKRTEGRGGWDDPEQCSEKFLATLLVDHLPKGDPIDVANFAMMLHQRGADRFVLQRAVKRRDADEYVRRSELLEAGPQQEGES